MLDFSTEDYLVLAAIPLLVIVRILFKRGIVYRYRIRRELNKKYGVEFKVLEVLGRNKQGYHVLKIAPKHDMNKAFSAQRINGSYATGGLPYWGSLKDDYEETKPKHS